MAAASGVPVVLNLEVCAKTLTLQRVDGWIQHPDVVGDGKEVSSGVERCRAVSSGVERCRGVECGDLTQSSVVPA